MLGGSGIPDKVTFHGQIYIHLLRSCHVAFCFYFAFMALAFVVGILGCWKVSSRKILCTSVLISLAFFFGTSGLILFQGVKYFERYKVIKFELSLNRVRNGFESGSNRVVIEL